MLLRLATEWNRGNDVEDLLWTIVNRYPQDKGATEALTRALFTDGQTRSLMRLFKQELDRTPSDLRTKNNVAMLALLLDEKELKPHVLAQEVYRQAPTNASYATTYAYSLYLQRKGAEALKVMQQIKPQDLDSPNRAGYYGPYSEGDGQYREGQGFPGLELQGRTAARGAKAF